MPYILSLGDLLLDVVVRYDPRSGEADVGPDGVQMWPGGSAANFAVWAARQGARVRFVGRVGNDFPGEMMVRSLADSGLEAEIRVIDEEPTGRVLVMVDPSGARRMWSYPGASATLSPADLDPAWFDGLDAFHLTGYSLLREGPRPAALEALHLARAAGALRTLDPNPPHLIRDYGPAHFRRLLEGMELDVLFPNMEEGQLLAGKVAPHDVAESLLDLAPVVALKLGDRGCIVRTRSGESLEQPAAPVDTVRDVTGAGDAFAAAFLEEYLRSRDLRAAARAATVLAAQVVGRVGAR
jgi:ribokinase